MGFCFGNLPFETFQGPGIFHTNAPHPPLELAESLHEYHRTIPSRRSVTSAGNEGQEMNFHGVYESFFLATTGDRDFRNFEVFFPNLCLPYIFCYTQKSSWLSMLEHDSTIQHYHPSLSTTHCGHLHSSMKGTPNSHRQNFIRLHLSVFKTFFFEKLSVLASNTN